MPDALADRGSLKPILAWCSLEEEEEIYVHLKWGCFRSDETLERVDFPFGGSLGMLQPLQNQ